MTVEIRPYRRSQRVGDLQFQRPAGLGLRGREPQPPAALGLHQMLPDADHGEVASAQGAGCQQGEQQPVPVLQGSRQFRSRVRPFGNQPHSQLEQLACRRQLVVPPVQVCLGP